LAKQLGKGQVGLGGEGEGVRAEEEAEG